MAEISRVALFGKLNSLAYASVESAAVFCKLRGNPYIELVHVLHQILKQPDSDVHRLVRHYEIDPSRLATDLTTALDALPRGATAISDLSAHVEESVERAWVYGTLMFGESQVRTGSLIVGMLKTPGLKHVLLSISGQWGKIKTEDLTENFGTLLSDSPEEQLVAHDGFHVGGGAAPGEASGAVAPAAMGKQEALAQFCTDLTAQAREGDMDPILGRDVEIRQIIDILMRRRQNNPILTGEAGVGKTAVVEGFAQRIAQGDVPPPLRDVSIMALDLGLLQAGASMKGEFENRLKSVIDEVQSSPKPIILFIDEAHTLIGAGGSAGSGDAANLLKPALARGKLRTVAATTWAEYKKYIEKDPALTRRFQVVKVEEPSEDKALLMIRGMATVQEKYHRVQILDEGLEAAVNLSHRYIPARQLPDKAVSLLDTACARVAVSQYAVPAEVEDCRRRIAALETELQILAREEAVGLNHAKRCKGIESDLAKAHKEQEKLDKDWQAEKGLVDAVLDIRAKLREPPGGTIEAATEEAEAGEDEAAVSEAGPSDAERKTLLKDLRRLQTKLEKLQGESPLILPSVDAQAVASVVADWTGIPVGKMVRNEIENVLNLADVLAKRVLGQRHALETVAKRIHTARAGLDNPGRPIGVFMLVGPSGVGKTESALALADALYGGEQNVITINMSEFQEAHTVSTLKGAPPGYVGYGEGGVLTEAVRRRPYSIVLLDEVEKAHKDVHEIFFQVFDKGMMEDGEGRLVDFKNTIILLTSNVGTDLILNMCKDPDLMPAPAGIAKALAEPLRQVFPAALLGRLEVVPYYPLGDDMLRGIIGLQLDRIKDRLRDTHQVPLAYDETVVDLVLSRCTEVQSGARVVDSILTHTMLPQISGEFLRRLMEGTTIAGIRIGTEGQDFTYEFA